MAAFAEVFVVAAVAAAARQIADKRGIGNRQVTFHPNGTAVSAIAGLPGRAAEMVGPVTAAARRIA